MAESLSSEKNTIAIRFGGVEDACIGESQTGESGYVHGRRVCQFCSVLVGSHKHLYDKCERARIGHKEGQPEQQEEDEQGELRLRAVVVGCPYVDRRTRRLAGRLLSTRRFIYCDHRLSYPFD